MNTVDETNWFNCKSQNNIAFLLITELELHTIGPKGVFKEHLVYSSANSNAFSNLTTSESSGSFVIVAATSFTVRQVFLTSKLKVRRLTQLKIVQLHLIQF